MFCGREELMEYLDTNLSPRSVNVGSKSNIFKLKPLAS